MKTPLGLGLDEQVFIRHVQCIWLTLIPAMNRVTGRPEEVHQHFFKDLPKAAKESKTEKTLEGNERYRRIRWKLKGSTLLSLEPGRSIRRKWSQRAGTERLVQASIYALITTPILLRLLEGSLAVPMALLNSQKQKVVNNRRTLLSDESNKDTVRVRVRAHSQAHAIPIT